MIRSLQQFKVKWHNEARIEMEETLRNRSGSYHRCWICGGKFKIGDGMTVAGSAKGQKEMMHSRCFKAQNG